MIIPTRPRKWSLLGALLCAGLAQGCGPFGPDSTGGDPPAASEPVAQCSESETQRLAEGVYAFRRGLYSTMFVVGNGGVVAFDPLGAEAECLDKAIRQKAPGLLVREIIYSHGDSDHIAGGAKLHLSPGARVFAQRQAVMDMQLRVDQDDVLPVTDVLDVNQDGSGQPTMLTLEGRRIALSYFGPTKSSGNLTIYLPDAQVAMFTDVILADTVPGAVLATMAPQGVLRALAELDKLSFQRIVVGHGPPASHDDVSQTLAFWTSYVAQARVALGKTTLSLTAAEALDGAPSLALRPQLPVQPVVDALRPYYGGRIGFDSWGQNGFDFAYTFLTGESPEPVAAQPTDGKPPPMSLQKVSPSTYYAQVGGYGSLVIDPDPDSREALVVVNPLGAQAAWLRQLLQTGIPGRRVGHIVYTHSHNDHIANAAVLCGGSLAGVKIYAHENAARDLRDRKNPSVAAPTDVITGQGRDLQIGKERIELRWVGPSFTDGNLLVNVPGQKVAMGVGLVQRGALPGLRSVATDPSGMYRALQALKGMGAEVYLTGQGGWLTQGELGTLTSATRDMLTASAVAMQADASEADLTLVTPVGPALRSFVDSVGGKVTQSLGAAYPMLKTLPAGAGNVGELGVTYCSAQASSAATCKVQ